MFTQSKTCIYNRNQRDLKKQKQNIQYTKIKLVTLVCPTFAPCHGSIILLQLHILPAGEKSESASAAELPFLKTNIHLFHWMFCFWYLLSCATGGELT